jgi:hypothetical protein
VPGAVSWDANLAADDRLDPVRRDDEICLDLVIDDDTLVCRADASDLALLEPGPGLLRGTEQSSVQDLPRNAEEWAAKLARRGAGRGAKLERLRWLAVLQQSADIQLLEDVEYVI